MNIKVKRLYSITPKEDKLRRCGKFIRIWSKDKEGIQVFNLLRTTVNIEFMSYTSFRWEDFKFKSKRG